MKIRTKLTIGALLPLGLFMVVGFSMYYMNLESVRIEKRRKIVMEIQREVSALDQVAHFYLLRHEERPKVQLRFIQESLSRLLYRTSFEDRQEELIMNRLLHNHRSVMFLITELTGLWENSVRRSAPSGELQDRLTGQVLERIRRMASDASRLQDLYDKRITAAQKRGDLLVLTLTGLSSGFVLIILFMIMRRISTAIRKLQIGTNRISEGDLNYIIPVSANDELAQLSRGFNEMAGKLEKSHAVLQQEVLDRMRAEKETEKYAAQLEASNRELQDFAFVASHDLQEPLRKIRAFGDQLKTSCSSSVDAEGLDYLERMQNAAARMQALIQALLDYSRITSKGRPFSPTDLAAVAHDAVTDLETKIEETGGKVDVDDLATIEADPIQMGQLFQNLISNALKFHGEAAPEVRIYGPPSDDIDGNGNETRNHTYTIFVEDNGIGFDEKYLDRIFAPFQRLHGRRAYEGTGIGLAICRKIVDRHGGTITARSKRGKGSTFIVNLPVKQSKGGYNERE